MRILLVITALFFLTSCVTGPKPFIEHGFYHNPEYQFSATIPPGWNHTTRAPEWIDAALSPSDKGSIKAYFSNTETKGAIFIGCESSVFDIWIVTYDDVKFEKLVDGQIALIRKAFEDGAKEDGAEIKEFSVKKHRIGSYAGGGSYLEIKAVFGDTAFYRKDYIYQCNTDDSCFLRAALISKDTFFDDNLKIYNACTDSLVLNGKDAVPIK